MIPPYIDNNNKNKSFLLYMACFFTISTSPETSPDLTRPHHLTRQAIPGEVSGEVFTRHILVLLLFICRV
jgi:hypothetical protein